MEQIDMNLAKELATRKLEAKFDIQRSSFYEYLLYYHEHELKKPLDKNRHIELICSKLEDVFYGRIQRLMINVPPRSLKTEIVAVAFPARCMWKQQTIKFMAVSYSATMAEWSSVKCRSMYTSDTYKKIFPRTADIRDDQNQKHHRVTKSGSQYYSAWADGTITGLWCDIMIVDDPIKPDDADSDVKRVWVNNNYHNTLESRFDDMTTGRVIIIMQRLHNDDLGWHLNEQEATGEWEKWERVVIKAIADEDEPPYRKQWESFFPKRFPLWKLYYKKSKKKETFAAQYQQQPTNKETQEFHEEWFKYYGTEDKPAPPWLRVFTTVDPAFKQGQENDESCVMTVWFKWDKAYILEYSNGRYTPDQLQAKILYHITKRRPEKIWIEAFQAQSMIANFLRNELTKRGMYANIEEIRQTWDKPSKIRRLVMPYKDWMIYHRYWMESLEKQLKEFPRGKHDDIIDALQMVYDLYTLQPNTETTPKVNIHIRYDASWQPLYS